MWTIITNSYCICYLLLYTLQFIFCTVFRMLCLSTNVVMPSVSSTYLFALCLQHWFSTMNAHQNHSGEFFFFLSPVPRLFSSPSPSRLALPGSWCKCSCLGRRYQFLKATQNNDCDYVSSPISYLFPWADSEFHVLPSHNCAYLWFCFSLKYNFIPCYLEFF